MKSCSSLGSIRRTFSYLLFFFVFIFSLMLMFCVPLAFSVSFTTVSFFSPHPFTTDLQSVFSLKKTIAVFSLCQKKSPWRLRYPLCLSNSTFMPTTLPLLPFSFRPSFIFKLPKTRVSVQSFICQRPLALANRTPDWSEIGFLLATTDRFVGPPQRCDGCQPSDW